jgi:hypothetical protein
VREGAAVAIAIVMLGMVLSGMACTGRWMLNRCRLAGWEAA